MLEGEHPALAESLSDHQRSIWSARWKRSSGFIPYEKSEDCVTFGVDVILCCLITFLYSTEHISDTPVAEPLHVLSEFPYVFCTAAGNNMRLISQELISHVPHNKAQKKPTSTGGLNGLHSYMSPMRR